jgi:hypothetical protein
MIINISLEEYLNNKIKNIKCRTDTAAYVINTLKNYQNSTYEFTNTSLTLQFAEAKEESSFKKYNDLADHLLFMESIYPGALSSKGASQEYYLSLGRVSYYKCYTLMNKTWPLYEELSDCLKDIIEQLHEELVQA